MAPFRKALLIVLFALPAFADQVIMKNGKIYKGRIMGETTKSLLISTPTPHFLPMSDIMTIVRESRLSETRPDPKRYVNVEAGLGAVIFAERELEASPAAQVHLGGGFRVHPLVQADAELNVLPAVSGRLDISNGQTVRNYSRFASYSMGFALRGYPLGMKDTLIEPYVIAGYQWARFAPKGAEDVLKGSQWSGGVGLQGPLSKKVFWDVRVSYARVRYGEARFLGDEAELRTDVPNDQVTLQTGLAYHF
jgi:hypothetical protein